MDNVDTLLRLATLAVMMLSLIVNGFLYVRAADKKTLDVVRKDQRRGDAELKEQITSLANDWRAKQARDGEFQTRLSVVETQLKHMPTHGDLLAIRNEMRTLNEHVAAIGERSETTQSVLQSIQRFLLEHHGR